MSTFRNDGDLAARELAKLRAPLAPEGVAPMPCPENPVARLRRANLLWAAGNFTDEGLRQRAFRELMADMKAELRAFKFTAREVRHTEANGGPEVSR